MRALLLLFAMVLVLGAIISGVRAHEPYSSWKMWNGVSCCNNVDCRPTRAYVDEEGRWVAWDGVDCVIIPRNALLPPNLAGDGRSHYCGKRGPIGALPYCFSPGPMMN